MPMMPVLRLLPPFTEFEGRAVGAVAMPRLPSLLATLRGSAAQIGTHPSGLEAVLCAVVGQMIKVGA